MSRVPYGDTRSEAMAFKAESIAQAEDGSELFDWLILMTGIVLMSVSILLAVIPVSGELTDDGFDRIDQSEIVRPA